MATLSASCISSTRSARSSSGTACCLPSCARSLLTGTWAGFAGLLFAVVLLAGQMVFYRRYYRERFLRRNAALLLVGWGALSGLIAGAAGQLAFSLLAAYASTVVSVSLGRYIGWVVLGGLFGWLMSRRMPNLPSRAAFIGGLMGGSAGRFRFPDLAAIQFRRVGTAGGRDPDRRAGRLHDLFSSCHTRNRKRSSKTCGCTSPRRRSARSEDVPSAHYGRNKTEVFEDLMSAKGFEPPPNSPSCCRLYQLGYADSGCTANKPNRGARGFEPLRTCL